MKIVDQRWKKCIRGNYTKLEIDGRTFFTLKMLPELARQKTIACAIATRTSRK